MGEKNEDMLAFWKSIEQEQAHLLSMILFCSTALTPVLFRLSLTQICWRCLLSMPEPLSLVSSSLQFKLGLPDIEAIIIDLVYSMGKG